jgi:hypothetical protein
VSPFAWIVLGTIGHFWYPLHATSASTILFASSAGCFANWARNRTYHCYFDGPLLLAAGAAFLLWQISVIRFPIFVAWALLAAGIGISFYVERRLKSAAVAEAHDFGLKLDPLIRESISTVV